MRPAAWGPPSATGTSSPPAPDPPGAQPALSPVGPEPCQPRTATAPDPVGPDPPGLTRGRQWARRHGPVIASMMPGSWMLAYSVRPSGEKQTPVNSEYSGSSAVPMFSSLRASG